MATATYEDGSRRHDRSERYSLSTLHEERVYLHDEGMALLGVVEQISSSGTAILCSDAAARLEPGQQVADLHMRFGGRELACGAARVARTFRAEHGDDRPRLALSFAEPQPRLVEQLAPLLQSAPYVNAELAREEAGERARKTRASDHYIDKFYAKPDPDLFAKCYNFRNWVDDMQDRGLYQRLFRVTVTSSIGNRVMVFDPIQRRERTLLCFDSNSYLCLHDHPRVIERVQEVVSQVGYGSPSAQLLGGTHRHLRELEAELSAFHGREDTIVFPTGFAANTGIVSALVRQNDALLRDRLAHASIQEACRGALARFNRVFRHNDPASLERFLQKADETGCDGKLIVTDGVFSMHGRISPLPALVELAKRYRARLMVDDAHGVGVIGAHGGGIEEHFGMPGSVDVLMGTLSKTIGALGGYVSGSRDLIYYLRFFAPSAMFTTSTPAAMCAGMVEALRIIRDEPEHHRNLWRNINLFVPALRAAGFIVPDPESPIVTVFLGADALMYQFSRELFDLGIKCSSVAYPAVPKDESILRLVVTSKHTPEDLTFAVEQLMCLGRKYGILQRSRAEICEIGKRLIADHAPPQAALSP
jgi:8-amino-7-oxononanoate synthase